MNKHTYYTKYYEIQFKNNGSGNFEPMHFDLQLLPLEQMKKKVDLFRKNNKNKEFRIVEVLATSEEGNFDRLIY